MTLAKKIERDFELQAKEDREQIRAQALHAGRQNGKTSVAYAKYFKEVPGEL